MREPAAYAATLSLQRAGKERLIRELREREQHAFWTVLRDGRLRL